MKKVIHHIMWLPMLFFFLFISCEYETVQNYEDHSLVWLRSDMSYLDGYGADIYQPSFLRVRYRVDKTKVVKRVTVRDYMAVVIASEMPIRMLYIQISSSHFTKEQKYELLRRLRRAVEVINVAARSYAYSWKRDKGNDLRDVEASSSECQAYYPKKLNEYTYAQRSLLYDGIDSTSGYLLIDPSVGKHSFAKSCYADATHFTDGTRVPSPLSRVASKMPTASSAWDPVAPVSKNGNSSMSKMGLSQIALLERCLGFKLQDNLLIDFSRPLLEDSWMPLYPVEAYLAWYYPDYLLAIHNESMSRVVDLSEVHRALRGDPPIAKLSDTIVVGTDLIGFTINTSDDKGIYQEHHDVQGTNYNHQSRLYDGSGPEVGVYLDISPGKYNFTVRTINDEPPISLILYHDSGYEICLADFDTNDCQLNYDLKGAKKHHFNLVIKDESMHLLVLESGAGWSGDVKKSGLSNEMPPVVVSFQPS